MGSRPRVLVIVLVGLSSSGACCLRVLVVVGLLSSSGSCCHRALVVVGLLASGSHRRALVVVPSAVGLSPSSSGCTVRRRAVLFAVGLCPFVFGYYPSSLGLNPPSLGLNPPLLGLPFAVGFYPSSLGYALRRWVIPSVAGVCPPLFVVRPVVRRLWFVVCGSSVVRLWFVCGSSSSASVISWGWLDLEADRNGKQTKTSHDFHRGSFS